MLEGIISLIMASSMCDQIYSFYSDKNSNSSLGVVTITSGCVFRRDQRGVVLLTELV